MLLLDDDQDVVESLAEVVESLYERRCVTTHSLGELIERRQEALGCDVAILDINLGSGRPSGIDAYHWLLREGFSGRIVFLTGHALSQPLVAQARQLGQVRVLQKPMQVAQLMAIVSEG